MSDDCGCSSLGFGSDRFEDVTADEHFSQVNEQTRIVKYLNDILTMKIILSRAFNEFNRRKTSSELKLKTEVVPRVSVSGARPSPASCCCDVVTVLMVRPGWNMNLNVSSCSR